jgi:hypothetical protein
MAHANENNIKDPNQLEERNTPPAFLDLADSVCSYCLVRFFARFN